MGKFAAVLELEGRETVNHRAIARALERAVLARKEMDQEKGGSRSSDQIADLLRYYPASGRPAAQGPQVNPPGRMRPLIGAFESGQFNEMGRPYPDLVAILEELPGDPRSDMIFFLSESENRPGRDLWTYCAEAGPRERACWRCASDGRTRETCPSRRSG
jgi:hypothetical protein